MLSHMLARRKNLSMEALTDALARDAVRVDARGYRGQSWWSEIDQYVRTKRLYH